MSFLSFLDALERAIVAMAKWKALGGSGNHGESQQKLGYHGNQSLSEASGSAQSEALKNS